MTHLGVFDGFIIDLDGVVWIGAEPIPGAVEALHFLRERGTRILFLTNDPQGSRADYAARLTGLGIKAAAEDVLTSGSATAEFIRRRQGDLDRTAFVIGSPALKAELSSIGLELIEGEAGCEAAVVVVGCHEGFDYQELRIAARAVRGGAEFFATGRDAVFPMPDGPWPATGAVLAAVETAGGRRAVAVGKPEPFIFEIARSLIAPCERVAIVGDHLESDIAGGKRAGMATILVLSGNARREDLAGAPVQPDIVLSDLSGLVELTQR